MRLAQAARCGAALLAAKVSGRATPLVVSWRLLNRCNLRCRYCYIPLVETAELTTTEVVATIDELARLGTAYLQFTGGEVLLREDLGDILGRVAERGIAHSINTNGTFVPGRIEVLRRVSTLTLSLDGPEDVHDRARGRGSFADVMAALDAARDAGIPLGITTVLSTHNVGAVRWLLDAARRYDAKISFQPGTLDRLGSEVANPITPPPDAYRAAIALLIQEKRSGNPLIASSLTTLEHLAAFPARRPIACAAGLLYFRIEANGDVLACTDVTRPTRVANLREHGVAAALAATRRTGCDECWGASRVEFNHAVALDPATLLNVLATR